MPSHYLDQLASFVVGSRLEDLDSSTVLAAKNVLLDTLGAILAGSRLPENASFAQLARKMGGSGSSTLVGHRGRATPVFAALVNATAGVSLEMDEGSRLGGGHPSIHVTPGAMAVAEELRSSGMALLEAIIVGYEVTSRIGTATQVRPEIHSHGTWGTIGTAAATARLLGLDTAQTRQTMNLATSMSPANTWTPCLEGATIRNLYPGRSGFQGILAAHLVRCGFTGIRDGPADLYQSILGQGFDPAAAVEGLGQRGALRIQQNYFKVHACCLYNHPALDAVQALRHQHPFAASEVASIRIVAPPLALTMTDPAPDNMLAAKFSIPYAVAAAVVKGTADVSAFYLDALADPEIHGLAQRVEVVADPEMSLRRYDYPASQVTLILRDGRKLEESVVAHRGDFRNPVPQEDLMGKFTSLARDTLGEERTWEVIDMVYRLDRLGDVRELTRLLQGKPGGH